MRAAVPSTRALASVFLWLPVVCAGCSIFNAPDRSRIVLADAGTDGPIDAPPTDAGDAGDGDGGDGGDAGDGGDPNFETDCENGADDDDDGATDCADLDCTTARACCADGTTEVSQDWQSLPSEWDVFPSDGLTGEPERNGGRITRFARPDVPSGLVRRSCVPMSLGAAIHVDFHPVSSACTEEPCKRFASLALTPVRDAAPGDRILAELAVTLRADGVFEVSRGSQVLRSQALPVQQDDTVGVDVQVTPGIGPQTGEAGLLVTVVVDGVGDSPITVMRQAGFIPRAHLVDDVLNCHSAPGLFVAVEGIGQDDVHLGFVEAKTLECVNPGQFDGTPDEDPRTLDVVELNLADWASRAVDTVAVANTCVADTCRTQRNAPLRWDVVASASNVLRRTENSGVHVGYSLGHAVNDTAGWDSTAPDAWRAHASEPRMGEHPPSCLAEPVCEDEGPSIREPGVWPMVGSDGILSDTQSLVVAYAQEWQEALDQGERDVYALHADAIYNDPTRELTGASSPVVTPGDRIGCDGDEQNCCRSLHHPEIVPAGPAREAGFWLLFTCVRGEEPCGPGDEIMAVKLTSNFSPVNDPPVAAPVLSPADLDAHSVCGPEVVVDFDESGASEPRSPIVRMWFWMRNSAGRTGVGLAIGQASSDEGQALSDRIPTLAPYEANPVLAADDPVLGACDGTCELMSFEVLRRADDERGGSEVPRHYRFLFTREVEAGGEVDYELIPLEQTWRTL